MYFETRNYEKRMHLLDAHFKLAKVLGYATSFTNFCSCAILILTIRHAQKVAHKLNQDNVMVENQLQLNGVVTFLHISVILGASITGFLTHS